MQEQEGIRMMLMRNLPLKYLDIKSDYQDFVDRILNLGKSFFITGSPGTGKTVLMADVMSRYFKRKAYYNAYLKEYQPRGKWISYPKFIIEIQCSFKDGNPIEMVESVANLGYWLAIDDLGAEKLTEFVEEVTYFILNEREQNMRKTIITSNLSLAQIADKMGERISSRIAGICDIIKLEGNDRRISG
jgi:DNA replication protein DnaC